MDPDRITAKKLKNDHKKEFIQVLLLPFWVEPEATINFDFGSFQKAKTITAPGGFGSAHCVFLPEKGSMCGRKVYKIKYLYAPSVN